MLVVFPSATTPASKSMYVLSAKLSATISISTAGRDTISTGRDSTAVSLSQHGLKMTCSFRLLRRLSTSPLAVLVE